MITLQHTLASSVNVKSIGLHTGCDVSLKINPAPIGHGIIFKRTDISVGQNLIPAYYNNVVDTRLCTVIANSAGVRVSTIEHLMAALYALKIDNALIEVDAHELPILDGSSIEFIKRIEKAGIVTQAAAAKYCIVKQAIRVEDGDKYIELSPDVSFNIHCSIDFPHPVIGKMQHSYNDDTDSFKVDIAKARTFGFIKDVEMLQKSGLALGASLDNAVGLTEEGVMNPEGLRYSDEFVRHKILDCVGDLALQGCRLVCSVKAHKISHDLNNKVLRKLFSDISNFEIVDGVDAHACEMQGAAFASI